MKNMNKYILPLKKILLIFAFCIPMITFAQSTYIYNIVSIEGNMNEKGIKVKVDDGKNIEKLKDENGKDIKFNTPAAALMYFISKGWELYINDSTSEGTVFNGIGTNRSTSYWIFRKPCTKEEFDKAVEEGIKK
ncbi:uncharacterized protein BN473_01821 [Prevotella sp. CAG:1185]|nr:uncharacterized protein BN473_01821 [Prevotella sp. CAG:1185]